jgi:hypothetical protein
MFCNELAESVNQLGLWVQLMLDTDLPAELMTPFLQQLVDREVSGWTALSLECLDHPLYRSSAITVILTHPSPPEVLLSCVLEALVGLEATVKTHCLRGEVSIVVLKHLLQHPDEKVLAAAVDGEWHAEPKGTVRKAVRKEWEAALITAPAEPYWLNEVFEGNPSLARSWLQARFDEGLPIYFDRSWKKAIQAVVRVLDTEGRSYFLHQLPEDDMMGEAVKHLVGDDLDVYRNFLEDDRYSSLHLIPLSRSLDEVWIEMVGLALDAGYNKGDIVGATFWPVGITIRAGPESKKWRTWVERFERLSEHTDPRIREIGRLGREQAQASLEKALKRELEEGVYGWPGIKGSGL